MDDGSIASNEEREEKMERISKIKAYGRTFGLAKRLVEDAVFHPEYEGELDDLLEALTELSVKRKTKKSTKGR
jgi:hypothetical protein